MLLGFDVLQLTPFWEKSNTIALVPSFKAMDLCREDGCERLAATEALRHLDSVLMFPGMVTLKTWDMRVFLSHVHMCGPDLRDIKDHDVISVLRQAVEMGHVVGLRQGDKSDQTPDETAEQRRLVRKIEQIARNHLSYSGRQFKLVVDVDLAKTPSRDSYEVVGQDDAKRVLDGVAKQSGTVPELTTLLGQASEKLTKDWGPQRQPDGLVLLRRIRQTSAVVKDTGPAITPSQMKKLLEGWISLDVVDDFDRPWSGGIKIELPDGSTRELAPDGEGAASAVGGFQPGNAVVSLLDLDETSWDRK